MDLNEVLVFARVVQAGSFTTAARLLGMPKSSVSKKVADLEDRLGTRLLQRTTRRVGLTDAGRVYFERSSRILAELEDADQAVSRLQTMPRGLLRVTAPLAFGRLGPIVADFLTQWPEVQIDLVCTDRLVDLVQENFDVGIRAGAMQDSSVVARKLGVIKRVLVASPAYVKRRGSPQTPEDLQRHDCISFSRGYTPSVWTLEFEQQTKEVRVAPRVAVNDFEMMLDAARGGIGIAWVVDFLAEHDIHSGRLRNVLPEWCSVPTPVHAIYPTARHLSPKVVRFIELLRTRFAPQVTAA